MSKLKSILRRLLDIRPMQKKVKKTNIQLPAGRMASIHYWENPKDNVTVRSSFNRELYYKYLKSITK